MGPGERRGHDGARVPRRTARVLPVSDDGEVLLVLDQDPARPGVGRWGSVGGGVDPGEDLVAAALRELREETGVVAAPGDLTAAFHREQRDFSYDGVAYRGDSTFFAMRLPRATPITVEHLAPDEVGNVLEWGWFTPEALTRDGRLVAPNLAEVLAGAVAAVRGDQGR